MVKHGFIDLSELNCYPIQTHPAGEADAVRATVVDDGKSCVVCTEQTDELLKKYHNPTRLCISRSHGSLHQASSRCSSFKHIMFALPFWSVQRALSLPHTFFLVPRW